MKDLLEVLGESSLRSLIIALATACVLMVLRVKSPRIRHHAWTGVLMAMLSMPLLCLWAPRIDIPVLQAPSTPTVIHFPAGILGNSSTKASSTELPILPISSAQPRTNDRPHSHISLYQIIGALYLAGCGVLVIKLLAGTFLSRRLVRGASRDGQILNSDKCTVPITTGLIRIHIILPTDSKEWDTEKLDAVIVHEKEHARRRDPLVEWIALLNRSLYWFHPLSWWLCARLSGLAEQACDEAVLARGHDRNRYAEFLLDFARSIKRGGSVITARGSSLHGSTLANRIHRILTAEKQAAISPVRLAFVAALCGISILIPSVCELALAQAASNAPVIASKTGSKLSPYAAAFGNKFDSSTPAMVQREPGQPNAPDQKHFEMGMEYLREHQYSKARMTFQTLIATYPESKLSAAAMMSLADSFRKEGGADNLLRALEEYKNVAFFFPFDPQTPEALKKIFSVAVGSPDTPSVNALIWMDAYVDTFLQNYPGSDSAPVMEEMREGISKEFSTMRLFRISGYVMDTAGNPLEGVAVVPTTSEPFQQSSYSNTNGLFVIRGVPQDQKTISLRFLKNGFTATGYNGPNPHMDTLRIMMNTAPIPSIQRAGAQPEQNSYSFEEIKKRFLSIKTMLDKHPDRDQEYSIITLEAIRNFLKANPYSDHIPTLNRYKANLEEDLALGDFKVAQFYSEKGNYAGAAYRLKSIIENYPNFSLIDEVNRLYESISLSREATSNTSHK